MFNIKKILSSKLFIRPLIACTLAILLTSFLASDVNSDIVMSAICGSSDIEVSDFYNRIRAGASQKKLDNEILVVNIDTIYDRGKIADLVSLISAENPKAICLDVLFEEEKDYESDKKLIEALSSTPNLVVSQRYSEADLAPESDFISENTSNIKRGMGNLTSITSRGIVREETPFFGKDFEYPSLAAMMLQICDPEKYTKLLQHTNDELIRFNPNEYYIAEPLELKEDNSMVNDKIVFIGTVTDEGDLHPTPLDDDYPGVMIHANSLSMMLHEDYINPNSEIYNLILGLLSCILVAVLYVYLDAAQNFVMRVFPIIWIAVIALVGCWTFNKWGIYLNSPRTIILACLSLVVLDTWYAFEEPVKKLWRKFSIKDIIQSSETQD